MNEILWMTLFGFIFGGLLGKMISDTNHKSDLIYVYRIVLVRNGEIKTLGHIVTDRHNQSFIEYTSSGVIMTVLLDNKDTELYMRGLI